ncbi:class I SAM-dependent methyltransferase [Fluviispira sanaruensis]|uniref:Class I SAM-dependent methyltransferase n=1 Tax=Fluviispira sanaruensis TaxID=2493639 RepID=A0A4P2VNB5_FLUSA|nr:class I SAM-dependent methyltransferase [Fluviispira sanaruensis]BBH53059.1 class I SAM-dependent methyltransferase [Fluviispira sanaruensis]
MNNHNILSHKNVQNDDFNNTYQELIKKIKNNNTDVILQDELIKILDRVKSSEMGRFLIENSGFNGFWTEYMCSYPETKKLGFNVSENKDENYLMENLPIAIATQSRYQIFKSEIKKRLKDNIKIASLPCGLMNDILSLNFHDYKNFMIHGIDLDTSSLQQARAISLTKGLTYHCKFTREDAWEINYKNEYDLFISNGLNIYVDNDEKQIEMYKKIHTSLKENGELLTSTTVPPPDINKDSCWDMNKINSASYRFQNLFFKHFTNYNENNLRTPDQLCKILEKSGFSNFKILPDVLGVFVTIVATKC